MKALSAAILVLTLSGCGLTPRQWAGITASVVITGALVAHQADSGRPLDQVSGKGDDNRAKCSNPALCK